MHEWQPRNHSLGRRRPEGDRRHPGCLTPGRLSRGINLHATKALRWSGLTQVVHKRFPTLARAEQRLLEDLKELQSLLQAWASRPDGPAAPLVFRAAFRMASAFRFSKRIGFTGVGVSCNMLFVEAGFPYVSQLGFHEWYVVSWSQGSPRQGQERRLRSWKRVASRLCSPSHGTSASERIWRERPCHVACRTSEGDPECIFLPIRSRLGYLLSINPFSSSGG